MSQRPDPSPVVASLAELGLRTASLIHELRQPVFALKGRLQLARGAGDPLSPAHVEELLSQIEHMEQVLAYYAAIDPRVTRSQGEPVGAVPLGAFDLRHPARRAVTMLRPHAEQIGATVELVEPPEPVRVSGREIGARQVVLNLLHNALEAVAGSARREIRVCVRGGASVGIVEVEDSGPGVAAEVRDRLFEPFVTTKGEHGVGLGLFIARKLAVEANGSLGLGPRPAGGTLATMELPLCA